MSSAGSSWFSSGLALITSNTWRSTKEKGRALRQQIHEISQSSVLDEAGIDDPQILTLTREDLNELFPGIRNFQLRRTIMTLITDTVKDSLQHGPETLAGALKHLMHKNKNNDAAVQDVLKESLRAFRQMEDQLKAAQASLKPYIEVLNSLTEPSARKEDWDKEGTSSRRTFTSAFPTDMNSPTMQTHSFEPSVRVHPFVCGQTLGTDKQILSQLKGVKESDLWDCQLILAFSSVASRAGTDTEEALKKIPADKPAVLVTMHHTFNPTYVCPSLNIASSQVNIVERVNVLFHDSHHGLLRCPANENAMAKLQSVLNRYM
ncbi:uncharacterized protein LOC107676244 isoform X2 [Sinocyclocheilus anshuiensis]|uniref:uncharacterized protein LOC107676244 isoform X2 n=1 Tax=Sinocyclocheilus anshuiensis TaxID=1608454 RepID=UPI0007B9E1E3|nr:PREDICTED: uncharacterized protein LOC107676244 isoform X2 [Sinocyclocheilus anshuiensis]